jgi:hypothetical protein
MRASFSKETFFDPMAGPAPAGKGLLQRKCACGNHTPGGAQCEACSKKPLQRRAIGQAQTEEAPPIVHEALSSPGQQLDAETRSFMESRFHQDFSRVRVHTDETAAQSAGAVNASAYTVGRDVVFGAGQYSPHTSAGRRLLAHELTHVVQQHEGAASHHTQLTVGQHDTVHERNADDVAERVVSENSARDFSITGASAQIQRGRGDQRVAEAEMEAEQAAAAKCKLQAPAECVTYKQWLETFPAPVSSSDTILNAQLPVDLRSLIEGQLGASGNLPDCADVALILRHYYLKARGRSFSFMVGRTPDTSTTFTLGQSVTDKEMRACMVGAGTSSFQETRKGFALADFYKLKGKNILNLKQLIASGLKPGDLFVWKRLPSVTGNFQGHAQTVQSVTMPQMDPKDPTKVTQEGFITLVQGNMSGGVGKGQLQQRVYTFIELTGRSDGDADIGAEPRYGEESFYGAGPWKG